MCFLSVPGIRDKMRFVIGKIAQAASLISIRECFPITNATKFKNDISLAPHLYHDIVFRENAIKPKNKISFAPHLCHRIVFGTNATKIKNKTAVPLISIKT